jgi:ubiquinone/menaquinone biosynthesis C-methylase UbiE
LGGEGEHLKFVRIFPEREYISLDPRIVDKKVLLKISHKHRNVRFVVGSVEDIPFPENYFDHIKSTCVLAHVDRLFVSVSELRRVSTNNCKLIILMPTDPGLLNLLVKKLFAYPKINRISKFPAGLIYSLDHKNSHNNILEVIKYVFSKDQIKITYLPFLVKSANINILSIVKITVSK